MAIKRTLFAVLTLTALLWSGETLAQIHPLQDTSPTTLNSGGVGNAQVGWQFTCNSSSVVVTELGCWWLDSNTNSKTLTLFDFTTQVILAQVTTTPGTGWIWISLSSPVSLVNGHDYVVVGFTSTVSYYYDCALTSPSPWMPTGTIQYVGERTCTSCTANTFPSSTYPQVCQYGVVDIGYTTNLDCGNGTLDSGETCDDGVANGSTDCGCQLTCDYSPAASSCGDPTDDDCTDPDTCDGSGACETNDEPDGTTCLNDGLFCTGTESCDTGVCTSPGDPCDPFTEICDEVSSSCILTCGNGTHEGAEQCDDGNQTDYDGCSSICTIEDGWICDHEGDAGPDECEEICGDGLVVGDEDCDDGNSISDDGCTDCFIDDGWECDDGEPSECTEGGSDGDSDVDSDSDSDSDSDHNSLTTDSCICRPMGNSRLGSLIGVILTLI